MITSRAKPTRSEIMRAVKSRDTKPEMLVRRLVHTLGYRYRLHAANLPGKPDMVFAGKWKVVFVHGCFWHGHSCKRGNRMPATNAEYWERKIARNKERDRRNIAALRRRGWGVLVVWECQTRDRENLVARLRSFLDRRAAR